MGTPAALLVARHELQGLPAADRPESRQVGDAFDRVPQLGRKVLEARIAAHDRVPDAPTDERRAALGAWRHGPMHAVTASRAVAS